MDDEELSRLLASLEKDLPGFKYALFDYLMTLQDRTINFSEFGFKVGDIACCGNGAYNGNLTCGIKGDQFTLCRDPNEFVFFDCAHSNKKVNRQLSSLMWSGKPLVIGPHNFKSFF